MVLSLVPKYNYIGYIVYTSIINSPIYLSLDQEPVTIMSESTSTTEKPKNARPGWDKSEWDAKAKAKDAHYAEQAKARDEAQQQGK